MQNIWNHDPNLLYYVNYQFPIASEGYGSTADQILLREGDVVSTSLYTDWSFYSDEAAGFHHLGLHGGALRLGGGGGAAGGTVAAAAGQGR